MVSVRW